MMGIQTIHNRDDLMALREKASKNDEIELLDFGLLNKDDVCFLMGNFSKVVISGDTEVTGLCNFGSERLRSLSISTYRNVSFKGKLSGNKFPNLEVLLIDGASSENFDNFDEFCSLRELSLQNGDFSDGILSGVYGVNSLSLEDCKVGDCEIGDASMETLYLNHVDIGFLDRFRSSVRLKNLSMSRLKTMSCLDGVQNFSSLEFFTMSAMPHICDLSEMSELPNLRVLQLVDAGIVNSFTPIVGARMLERFLFIGSKAKVKDLDMSWLHDMPKLKYAKFVNRRGYSNKSEEFPK